MRLLYIGMMLVVLCCFEQPVYADPIDSISAAIFDDDSDKIKVKAAFRVCNRDSDCTAVLVLCRWRAVSNASEKYVNEVSGKVTLECKWPPPPVQPPAVRCINKACDILPDGKYY